MRSLMTFAILLALCSTANAVTRNEDDASQFDAVRVSAAPFLSPADEDNGEGPGDGTTPRLAPADEDNGEGPGDGTRAVVTRPADEDNGEGPNGG
ncbi:MAG: hypothetical protein ACC645_09370 [Pirellulales bacterium]